MTQSEREWTIYQIEEFYCNRMEYLMEKEHFDDAHSIFEEFVLDGKEPKEYVFMSYHEDIE